MLRKIEESVKKMDHDPDIVDKVFHDAPFYIKVIEFIQNMPLQIPKNEKEGEKSYCFISFFNNPNYIQSKDRDDPTKPYHHLYTKMRYYETTPLKGTTLFIDYLHTRAGYSIFNLYQRILIDKGLLKDMSELKCDPIFIHKVFYRAEGSLNATEVGEDLGEGSMKDFDKYQDIISAYKIANSQQQHNFIKKMLERIEINDKEAREFLEEFPMLKGLNCM